MRNRRERRKAAAAYRKNLARLNTATLDQHFDATLRSVRAEFERAGVIHPRFECVTDGKIFHVPARWPHRAARPAVYAVLRDSFRRRGVNRYVFASEAWVGKTPGLLPTDDPDRSEGVQVIAVERNGPRRYAFAEITRNGGTATIGPWEVTGDVPQSWLFELLEDGHSDRVPKAEPPPVGRISRPDFQDLMDQHPEQATEFRDSLEIHSQLGDLMAGQVQKDANGDPHAMYLALETVVRNIVKDQGSPKGVGGFARLLRDHPDRFPMFSIVSDPVPSALPEHLRHCKATLQHFICEKREAGNTLSALFGAFMNMYLYVGSQAIGALKLADRIENWDPEHQAKLRQVGLRSSFELDDEEGRVFIALSADRYPVCVMGRRNAVGDLFVTGLANYPEGDFATAVDKIKQMGIELFLGSEAEELVCKMEQVKGVAPRADKPKEIWEVENWGHDEWTKQVAAEHVFAEVMNVQYVSDPPNRNGVVAGYRVRCAPDGLVLIPSDSDDDIFVAVNVEITKRRASVLGWLRASEGKLPQFYQKNYWVIPPEALHPMETLPGKERLLAMPPYQEPDLNDLPNDGD